MGCKPSGAAAQPGQLCRCVRCVVVLDASFAGLALLVVVEVEDQIVGRVVEGNEAQVRLQREARSGVESDDLIESERRAICVIKGFNKCPLYAGYVNGEAVATASKTRIRSEPLRQLRAKITQRERTARMCGEISNRQALKRAGTNDREECGKVLEQGSENAKPILAVVDFEAIKGGQATVWCNERVGDRGC